MKGFDVKRNQFFFFFWHSKKQLKGKRKECKKKGQVSLLFIKKERILKGKRNLEEEMS